MGHSVAASSSFANDPRIVTQALSLSLKHKNEYLDDHAPLLGDPASFLQAQPGTQRGGTPSSQAEAAKKQATAATKGGSQPQVPAKKKGKGLAP
jgi:mediator of RNA polymerase II transcription subunit 6